MADADVELTEEELEQARSDREGLEWLAEVEASELETVQPIGAPSATRISDVAFDLIVEFEVSSQQVYTSKYRGAIWPGGESGATVGVGYDVGYATAALLQSDFGGEIGNAMIDALKTAIGKTGAAGKQATQALAGKIDVPWSAAISVHRGKVMPRWVGVVERALPNTGLIGPDCLGALVSLTYNRGASFPKAGDRYQEMRAIKAHMAAKDFASIPGDLRAMKRIWPTVPGLQKRREREARLFEAGLRTV